MPFTGGFSPAPITTGGGDGGTTQSASLLQRVFESIAGAMGSLYDQTINSYVGVANMAAARVITFDGYGQLARLVNNFYPGSITIEGNLARWEKIFGIVPYASDTEVMRNARISAKWKQIGSTNGLQPITDICNSLLGARFVKIQLQSPGVFGSAQAYWDNDHGISSSLVTPWYSSVSHIIIFVTFDTTLPSNLQIGELLNKTGPVAQILVDFISSWVTFNFAVLSSAGTPIFKLNDPRNLNFEVLG